MGVLKTKWLGNFGKYYDKIRHTALGKKMFLFLILFGFIVLNHCLEGSALKSWWAGGQESMTTFQSLLFLPGPTKYLREQQCDCRTWPVKPCGGLNLFSCHRKYNLWWLFRQATSPSLQIVWNYGFQQDGKSRRWWQSCRWKSSSKSTSFLVFLSHSSCPVLRLSVAYTNHVNHTKASSANLQ